MRNEESKYRYIKLHDISFVIERNIQIIEIIQIEDSLTILSAIYLRL